MRLASSRIVLLCWSFKITAVQPRAVLFALFELSWATMLARRCGRLLAFNISREEHVRNLFGSKLSLGGHCLTALLCSAGTLTCCLSSAYTQV